MVKKILCCGFAFMSTVLSNITSVGTSGVDIEPVYIESSDRVCVNRSDVYIQDEEESIEYALSIEDIELIALVTMAEAEGENIPGKRLVIDTILNRVDSEYFPNTVYDVIYQPDQFSAMWNGRVDKCYVTDEIKQFVIEEIEYRSNYDVIFFNANNYSVYGKPMFKEDNHYFSSY